MKLGTRDAKDLITIGTEQQISGNITVQGSLIVTGHGANVYHLFTENNVFGVNLSEILNGALTSPLPQQVRVYGDKWFENVTFGHVILEQNDFWGIGSTTDVDKHIKSRNTDVVIDGSTIFNKDFVIGDLVFTEYLNGISSSEFGKQWLLIETDQVNCNSNLIVK